MEKFKNIKINKHKLSVRTLTLRICELTGSKRQNFAFLMCLRSCVRAVCAHVRAGVCVRVCAHGCKHAAANCARDRRILIVYVRERVCCFLPKG